ncbi:deoxycytidyl transferase [Didymosphaeria variabile]|uniref:DNA repair protein REV1 n=1 Tax=Didymosphaeria variabile TaxID=1932322 RepID=A0A9W8XCU6_9PLEO|nr:deoxycytidyl transferase [Didymosphaeria variabile]KAJ4347310.1 deoxycytidyl transferase [Didymosphaeria variabile]
MRTRHTRIATMGSRLENNSNSVRKRIAKHTFDDEDGEEYGGSKFGGFPEYFRRKKIKLQNLDADLRSQSTDKPPIFRGIVAHVNGYTQPSLNDLHTLIVQYGGGFMQYLDGKTTVTHIIASSLTPKKAIEFRKYRIVKPAWVVDSIEAGKLLPWNSYRVLDEGENQKVLAFDNGKVSSASNKKAQGYRDQSDKSWYASQLRSSQFDEPASTPTPMGSMRSRFSRERLPTPGDEIEEDVPPSHQPEHESFDRSWVEQLEEAARAPIVTPPKTSPTPEDQADEVAPAAQDSAPQDDDDLYADPDQEPIHSAQKVVHPDEQGIQYPAAQERAANAAKSESIAKGRPLTAEEHNAILLRDPKIRRSTVVDPNFLEQYYRESRLHHLSTWKADLKSQLQALASEKSLTQTAKQKRPPGARRYILHVDFDSFFAAVSLKKNPQYKDKPAVVAHGNGSGSEIASCNYPARKFGVKNGMWMKRAMELCPDLKILPYDFPAYEDASRAFYDAILATGGIVQSVSIDEALIDISNLCIGTGGSDGKGMSEGSIYREQAKAEEIAKSLRDQVKARTDCNVSVGIGGNILLAKVALRKAKPAGQHQIKPDDALDFIGQLQVQDLPGVAWSIGGKLEEIGIKFVKDIREFTKERLVQTLGPKTGDKLWEYSRGIDRVEVGEQVVRKSVSAEVNWGVRFENQAQADEFIESLCGELQKRLLKEKVKGKQFTMKIMRRSPAAPLDPPKHLGHGQCDTYNKSMVLGVATNAKEVLTKEALSILKGFGVSPGELRGIGVQMTKLEPMKSATDGTLESSQRRLQFRAGPAEPKPTRKKTPAVVDEIDPIQDDPVTPRKPKAAVEDEHVAFGPAELNHSTPSRRPLNMMGTQFIMPTQVDPQVLAELPEDIRSKLMRQGRQSSPTPATSKAPRESLGASPSPQKAMPFALTAPLTLPTRPRHPRHLAPDVRAEVLSQYAAAGATPHSPSRRPKRIDQTLLPQSPRKNRLIGIPAKRAIVPPSSAEEAAPSLSTTRRRRARAHKRRHRQDPHTSELHLTQEPRAHTRRRSLRLRLAHRTPELDPDFLAALPRRPPRSHRRAQTQKTPSLAPRPREKAQSNLRTVHPRSTPTPSLLRGAPAPPNVHYEQAA